MGDDGNYGKMMTGVGPHLGQNAVALKKFVEFCTMTGVPERIMIQYLQFSAGDIRMDREIVAGFTGGSMNLLFGTGVGVGWERGVGC